MNKKRLAPLLAAIILLFSTACAEETVQTIMNVGTTQAFLMDAVPQEDVDTILRAGLSAASAINQQPWHLVAVTNQELMAELAGGGMTPPANMPAGEAPAGMPAGGFPQGEAPAAAPAAPAGVAAGPKAGLGSSPLAILVYMSESTMSPNPDFDCGLACQNMVIAAGALGYGAKIVSAPTMNLNGENHDAICEKLGIDASLQAVAVLLVGKADSDTTAGASVRSTLEEKATYVP